jgi:transcriptional regulator with XRE-family HTH domain
VGIEARLDVIGNRVARRGQPRRNLILRTKGASTVGDAVDVTIHNLSATGLLLHTSAKLVTGDEINLELPEAPQARAKVVWADETLFGCEFVQPVSRAVLSATELLSRPNRASQALAASEQQAIEVEPFGARLRRLRKARGISLAAFAKSLQVSRPAVWAWEAGKSVPRRAKMAAITAELGISDEEMFGSSHEEAFHRRVELSSGLGPQDASAVDLADFVARSKGRIAELAGTTPDKVRVVIEI